MPIQCAGGYESTVCLHMIANNSAMRQSGDMTAFQRWPEPITTGRLHCETQLRLPTATNARAVLETRPSRDQRAQRKPGAQCTHGLVRKLESTRVRNHRFTGNIRPSLCAMVFWFNFFPAQPALFEKTFAVWALFQMYAHRERGKCNQLCAWERT